MAVHAERVSAHPQPPASRGIDDRTFTSLTSHADADVRDVAARLEQLDREWDIDRVLETEAAATGLLGLALGGLFGSRLLMLPATVAGAVLLHARTGWYPLMPLFRRLGIRSAREIARERYAIKALRGDFGVASAGNTDAVPEAAMADSTAASTRRDGKNGRLPPTARRVEQQTSDKINKSIRAHTDRNVEQLSHASPAEIDRRLAELDQEWDIERVLQANASFISILGIALGAFADRRFLVLPTAVFGFFAQHALQGWCPPIPLFRRLGVRATGEIERERYALKALRGDFAEVPEAQGGNLSERVRTVLAAVDA